MAFNEQSCSLWSGLLKRPTESNYIGTNTIKLRLYKKLPSTKARLSPSCWSVVSCGILKGKMFQIVFLNASPQKSKIQETSWRSNCSLRRIVSNLGQYVSTNISNTRDSGSSGYPNIEKRVENMTRSGAFLTKFEVLGWPMKHCLSCLICLLNRNKI